MILPIKTFCTTRTGIPIFQYGFGVSGPQILILGGVHGDEPEGVVAARGLLQKCLQEFPFQIQLTLIPEFNIEGILKNTRTNGVGVDLNRNLPTRDWSPVVAKPRYHPGPAAGSEPESLALVHFLQSQDIKFVVSLHSWEPMLNVNGDCEPEAGILAKHTGYEIKTDIGYPTPGSLGTYTGLERGIPTVTYEIQRDLDFAEINRVHVPALWDMLKSCEAR